MLHSQLRGAVMRAVLAAGVCLALACVPASASGYQEFVKAISLSDTAPDQALGHFTAALADPQLLANLKPVALYDRGDIYARQGKYDLAAADYTASLGLRADFDAYT